MSILHIDSSIQGDASASRALSATVAARLAAQTGAAVTYRDLAANPLPHLTLDALADPAGNPVLDEFLAADTIVIGAAFYNFSIASQLKAWFDRILIAGKTFRYTEAGPEGLAGGKRVIVTLARGGVYSNGAPAAPLEHGETLLRGLLGFIGITDPEFIIAEGLALGEERRRAALADALAVAERVEPLPLAA